MRGLGAGPGIYSAAMRCLTCGSGDAGGDDVNGVAVRRGPGPLWRMVVRGSACEVASCTSLTGTPASSAAVMNACRHASRTAWCRKPVTSQVTTGSACTRPGRTQPDSSGLPDLPVSDPVRRQRTEPPRMACKSWYPCGTLRWRENRGQAGVGVGGLPRGGGGLAGRVCGSLAAVWPGAVAGCWWLPADAGFSMGREPVCKSGAGALTYGSRTVASSTPVRFWFRPGPRASARVS
jgi:hypothetical protein